jgi:hypothetical protein
MTGCRSGRANACCRTGPGPCQGPRRGESTGASGSAGEIGLDCSKHDDQPPHTLPRRKQAGERVPIARGVCVARSVRLARLIVGCRARGELSAMEESEGQRASHDLQFETAATFISDWSSNALYPSKRFYRPSVRVPCAVLALSLHPACADWKPAV